MKETIAVLFGGQSSEHVVSCMSAVNVIEHIDREKYEVLLIGITEQGRWLWRILWNRSAQAHGMRERQGQSSLRMLWIRVFWSLMRRTT